MMEQLQIFEPSGPEVLALAQKHEKTSSTLLAMAKVYDLQGWQAVSRTLHARAAVSQRHAAEMLMLAEFEALGGVA